MTHRRPRLALLPLVLVAAAASARSGALDLEASVRKLIGQRHWYGIYLKNQKSGYALMEVVEATARDRKAVEFRMRAKVKITALGKQQDMRIDESRVYLRSGPLHSVSSRFWTQTSDVAVTAVAQGDKLILTAKVGALTKHKELPLPKETLADSLAADRLIGPDAKIGDTATVYQFEPTMQKEFEGVLTLKERKRITFNSVPTDVAVLQLKLPVLGVTSDMFVDAQGTALELTVGGMFVLRLEPEKQAKDIHYSSDLIRLGCVHLDPRPTRVAQIREARFQIWGIDDPALLLKDERQAWTPQPDGSHIVAIRVPPFDPAHAATLPIDRTRFATELAPTIFVQSDDPRVKALAAKIVGDERNAYAAARKISRWLYTHLKKVGTAALSNAVETLTAMEGDCTEHTVLFVALSRAAGIPAREVAGVVAIERGEGLYYHAWPEVWVGQWVALDPTLGQDIADGTHIKFAEGGADQVFRIVALFGRIKAKLLHAVHAPQ